MKLELSGSRKELKDLSKALQESYLSLQLSSRLLKINECIKTVEQLQQKKRYIEIAETLHQVHVLLSDSSINLQTLDIYRNLENEFASLYAAFVTEITEQCQEFICWKEVIQQKEIIATLTIENETKEIQDIVLALYYVDHLSKYLQTFSTNLLRNFINPIISYDCSVYVIEEKVFNVKILNKSKSCEYKSVFYNLKLLFTFLNQHLNINVAEKSFLERLGEYLLDEFSKILIKNCIANTIPNSSVELLKFQPIVEDINEFQDYLIQIGKL